MSLFFTGKGDKGTSIVGKKQMDKGGLEAELLGMLDELNSLLGLIKSQNVSKNTKKHIENIQEKLFIVQAYIAAIVFQGKEKARITTEHIKEMEEIILAIEKEIKPARKFIISGEHEISAWLDYARAVARRVERELIRFRKRTFRRGSRQAKISPETLAFINRLSSFLFALARHETKRARKKEKHPKYK